MENDQIFVKQAIISDTQQKQLSAGFDSRGLQILGLSDTEDKLPKNIIFEGVNCGINIARKKRLSIITKQVWQKNESWRLKNAMIEIKIQWMG